MLDKYAYTHNRIRKSARLLRQRKLLKQAGYVPYALGGGLGALVGGGLGSLLSSEEHRGRGMGIGAGVGAGLGLLSAYMAQNGSANAAYGTRVPANVPQVPVNPVPTSPANTSSTSVSAQDYDPTKPEPPAAEMPAPANRTPASVTSVSTGTQPTNTVTPQAAKTTNPAVPNQAQPTAGRPSKAVKSTVPAEAGTNAAPQRVDTSQYNWNSEWGANYGEVTPTKLSPSGNLVFVLGKQKTDAGKTYQMFMNAPLSEKEQQAWQRASKLGPAFRQAASNHIKLTRLAKFQQLYPNYKGWAPIDFFNGKGAGNEVRRQMQDGQIIQPYD